MLTWKLFLSFCDHLRLNLGVSGHIIYSKHKLLMAGWPYPERTADNDNEAIL